MSDKDKETETSARTPGPSTPSPDEGRFLPGTLLADRYRIVSLLGRGGMGEVYRATDVKLGQTVALKFLPNLTPEGLARFTNEIRLARQVSHPYVCRVHDFGEAGGHTFFSMEYVAGENLATLVARAGRLSVERGVEMARKLCAGIAAAHAKGVLHRDLKPANILIDPRGNPILTDFGLAAVGQVRGLQALQGTPAYMAPEQREGREATVQSDIYSLGLVLYEIFTGKYYEAGATTRPTFDAAVESVVTRCLDPDPAKRPRSALAVAAALPGGDPLAAALEAGQTPSPEMVANAGETEGMRIPAALACLAVVVVGLAGLLFLKDRTDLIERIPLPHSSEVLAAKGREIAASLGYTESPFSTAEGWTLNGQYLSWASRQKDAWQRLAGLGANRPPGALFWYRESPSSLFAIWKNEVDLDDPPPLVPRSMSLVLDSEGRLVEFRARPPSTSADDSPRPPMDWSRIFALTGLDPARFTPATPLWTPEMACDTRVAWTGSWPGSPTDPIRLDAAAEKGRAVFIRVAGPWSLPNFPVIRPGGFQGFSFLVFSFLVLPAGACLLVWRNLRAGRGDVRGANRLALFVFVCALALILLRKTHAAEASEAIVLFWALRDALFSPALVWVFYMAFEPYVRRRSPETLIAWTRLVSGRWRDPVVGRDVLVGLALGIGTSVATHVIALATPFWSLAWQSAPSSNLGLAALLLNFTFTLGGGLLCMFLLLVLRMLLRRTWLAAAAFVLVVTLISAGDVWTAGSLAIWAVPTVAAFYALSRFGLVATVAMLFAGRLVLSSPLTTHLAAWHARSGVLAAAAIITLALYGFHATLAGRPLWRDELQNG
jgi:serine/threonine-protein kinase